VKKLLTVITLLIMCLNCVAEEDTWYCSACGTTARGNFCYYCGAKYSDRYEGVLLTAEEMFESLTAYAGQTGSLSYIATDEAEPIRAAAFTLDFTNVLLNDYQGLTCGLYNLPSAMIDLLYTRADDTGWSYISSYLTVSGLTRLNGFENCAVGILMDYGLNDGADILALYRVFEGGSAYVSVSPVRLGEYRDEVYEYAANPSAASDSTIMLFTQSGALSAKMLLDRSGERDKWLCLSCGSRYNSGNFCTVCGSPKSTPAPTPTPALVPTATPTAPAVSYNDVEYVYVSGSGSFYHTLSDCGGMTNPSRVTVDVALIRNLAPCPDCAGGSADPGNTTITYYATSGGAYYHIDKGCSGMMFSTIT